jgi:sugar lactone lactonase YvrE
MAPLALIASATLMACVVAPIRAAAEEPEVEPIFYPAPPNQPKLQFLTKFSSVLDLSTGKRGFRDFVFGGEENESHLVTKPYGLAFHDGAIFVVDTRSNGWGIFDLAKKRSRMVQPGGSGALQKPINITIDADGTRYVTDTGREQVLVYDAYNKFLRAYGVSGQFRPVDVAVMGDELYVTDVKHHRIVVLNKNTGEIVRAFGEAGSEPGQLFQPTNLTVGQDDTIYVSDTGNFRVQEFRANGEFVREIGQIGTRPGNFARPKGIALDRDDNIYVVDAAFSNVQILDPLGLALMFFGQSGAERDSINLPTVVKIDYDNVSYFQQYAAPGFEIEYLVAVASQFGPNKVSVYGFGSLRE